MPRTAPRHLGNKCLKCSTYEKYTVSKSCVQCTYNRAKKRDAENVQQRRERWKRYAKRYPAKLRYYDSIRCVRDAEKRKIAAKRYYSKNPEKILAYNAVRKYRVKLASPKWLSKEQKQQMRDIYIEAKLLTKNTEIPHHVDHIVPLKGKLVCGLHVPWNLQILTAEQNLRKRNRHDA